MVYEDGMMVMDDVKIRIFSKAACLQMSQNCSRKSILRKMYILYLDLKKSKKIQVKN
jgi:hypothetical protein